METREPQSVLVYAPVGRDGSTIAGLLSRSGIAVVVCADYDALVDGLADDTGAVFVAEEGLFGQALERLWAWVDSQPPWSDLPFLMLTSGHVHPKVAEWRKVQVGRLGNVSLIERPVQPITLVSVMQAALRARARQQEVRALLDARQAAAADLENLVARRTGQLQSVNRQLREEMAERSRIEASLRHAQKLEALGQLTGGVAHDFNNLLMVITAGLDMLDRKPDAERAERIARGMRQAAQRGAGLTRQLLAFSRSHALRPETVDLARLIGEMSELLDRSLRGDIQVRVELAADLWPVIVDPGELELVILNLAVNARDAMNGSGTITISGHNADARAAGGDGFVRLSVRDTGAGMSEEVKARVFEPFFTTKDVGKGSGLGLAQVYGFAKQSGGSVGIDSAPGQGTTITLMLPRGHAPVRSETTGAPPADTAESPALHQCVLLVEDDAEVAALVEQMLRFIGCDVVHAASANAALGALADRRRVDLVFSDIMMPGGTNGVDLAREIRRRRPELPILLTSGYAGSTHEQARDLGIPLLPKPYGIDELRNALADQLRGEALAGR